MTIKRFSLIIICLSLLIRIFTFIASANFGADSISRSFISLNWSNDPFLIWHPNNETSVWLPLQFYINGLILMIWDNVQLIPRLVSLIASLFSLPLLFGIAGRLFDRERAYFATACFSLFSLHIKFGNIAGSESLFILMVLLAIYAYHRFLDRIRIREIILLSGAMLLAVMIRFEAWMLPPFIFMALLIQAWNSDTERRRGIIIGAITVSILPALFMIFWMYGSFREYGDILYSLHAASSEHVELTRQAVGRLGDLKTLLYNTAFWPGVLLISLSPLVLVGGVWGLILAITKRGGLEWVIFFAFQVGLYLYQSIIAGELAPLARYMILPGTILCLFSAQGCFDLADRLKSSVSNKLLLRGIIISALAWVVLLCPNYRDSGNPYLAKLASVSPVTQYPAFVKPVIFWLRSNLYPGQTVIFNSPSFTSNAVIMYSGVTPAQVISVNENSLDDVTQKIRTTNPSYLICHQNAPLRRILDWRQLESSMLLGNISLQFFDRAGDFGIYTPQYEP